EGNTTGVAEARTVGFSPADSGPDPKIDVMLWQASVFIYQGKYHEAATILAQMQPERMTMYQAYRLFVLRGEIHIGQQEYQDAVVDLRSALQQAEGMKEIEFVARVCVQLGNAYFLLQNYTLAKENHLRSKGAIDS